MFIEPLFSCADHRHHFNYMMNYDAQNKSSFKVGLNSIRKPEMPVLSAAAAFPDFGSQNWVVAQI